MTYLIEVSLANGGEEHDEDDDGLHMDRIYGLDLPRHVDQHAPDIFGEPHAQDGARLEDEAGGESMCSRS